MKLNGKGAVRPAGGDVRRGERDFRLLVKRTSSCENQSGTASGTGEVGKKGIPLRSKTGAFIEA